MLLAVLLLAPVLTRGPILVGVTSESAYVVWQTSEKQANGTVKVGTAAGTYAGSVQDSAYTDTHHALLAGLLPSTTYHYAIDSDPRAQDSSFTTAPAGPVTAPIRFVVYGDNRTDTQDHQSVVNAILGEPDIAFLVHTGDMAQNYPFSQEWDTFFQVEHDLLRSAPLFPTIGNHETLDSLYTWGQYFSPPRFDPDSGREHPLLLRRLGAAPPRLARHLRPDRAGGGPEARHHLRRAAGVDEGRPRRRPRAPPDPLRLPPPRLGQPRGRARRARRVGADRRRGDPRAGGAPRRRGLRRPRPHVRAGLHVRRRLLRRRRRRRAALPGGGRRPARERALAALHARVQRHHRPGRQRDRRHQERARRADRLVHAAVARLPERRRRHRHARRRRPHDNPAAHPRLRLGRRRHAAVPIPLAFALRRKRSPTSC